MARQTLNIHEPNDLWLNKIVASKEYASKSELVNDLIRQARKRWEDDFIRRKIEIAEHSGFSTKTQAEILEKAKSSILDDL
jgi:antitoxin ParD1/3/4